MQVIPRLVPQLFGQPGTTCEWDGVRLIACNCTEEVELAVVMVRRRAAETNTAAVSLTHQTLPPKKKGGITRVHGTTKENNKQDDVKILRE